ncbi:PQQ-dependent sugar dehydrogenase [Pontibacter sp. HJ8]
MIFLLLGSYLATAQPSGFVVEEVGDDWNAAVGLTFSKDGEKMYVWEKAGKVWIVENGERLPVPMLDISEEVGDWGDHGLLGLALDPNFDSNGYIYLLYVVDRHHLLHFGTGNYSPAKNEYYDATIGRVTRYTARASDNRRTIDPNSRKVLLGETKSTGVPVLYESHGIGTLMFGEDGSLLISTGDGATAGWPDYGYMDSDPNRPLDTYVPQALKDGIMTQKVNVGAYRSQQLESLNGKILRINPATGDGMPGNPFYEAGKAREAASRIWSLGLRNPFRFSVKPGSGSATSPGVLYIGDSGWSDREEVNVATKPGMNFGWPLFEGLEAQNFYIHRPIANTSAPNPLNGEGNCAQPHFYFRDLILQPVLNGEPYFGNPCRWGDLIPKSIPTFTHARPSIEWGNGEGGSRVGTFDSKNNAAVAMIGAAGSPVTGPQFNGSSSTGGVWYTGDDFPAEYKNTYFFGDYGAGWIRSASFDNEQAPKAVRNFIDKDAVVVAFASNPVKGGLYYINYATQIKKVNYYSGNTPPKAVAKADKLFGPSPLLVQFKGDESTDAEGAVTYEWDFGDGSAKSKVANPQHTYTSAEVGKKYDVVLKVTDAGGLTTTARLSINLNNTPPKVKITSPAAGTLYTLKDKTVLNLRAEVTDDEHSATQLTYKWQTVMHHNDHVHPEPIDEKKETTATITPIGCDGNTYFYRINLTVTDAGGLSTTTYVDVLPDCSEGAFKAITVTSPVNNSNHAVGAPIELKITSTNKDQVWSNVAYYRGNTLIGETGTAPYSYTWTGAAPGSYRITAKVTDDGVHFYDSDPVNITVGEAAQPVELPNCLPGLAHYFPMDAGGAEGVLEDYLTPAQAACTDCPTPVEGKFHDAQRFDGAKTGLDVEIADQFDWKKDANFTIKFWMRSSSTKDGNSVIIGRNATDSKMHWWVGVDPNGQVMFMLRDLQHIGIFIGAKGPKVNDGKWHQVVAMRDGSNKKSRLYIDGALVDEAEYSYERGFEGTVPVNIGYMKLDNGYHYNGDLDELKLFNRALTPQEVASAYNSGEGSYCGATPLGIKDEEQFKGVFEVFPNPAAGGSEVAVRITTLSPNEKVKLVLTDITGRKILEKKVTATPEGAISTQITPNKRTGSGVYNLSLSSEERTINRKIVIID